MNFQNMQEFSTMEIIKLAKEGNPSACMELSNRYKTGTALLEQNASLSQFWKNRAETILEGKYVEPIEDEEVHLINLVDFL